MYVHCIKWLVKHGGIALTIALSASAQELQIQDPEAMRAELLKLVPRSNAITQVIGNGRGELFVMVDPLDPASRRLVRAIQDVPNATVRYYLAPNGVHDSFELSQRIWCARHRAQALLDVMVAEQDLSVPPNRCNTASLAEVMLTINDKVMRSRPGFLTAKGLGTGVPRSEELVADLFPFTPPRGTKLPPACGRYNEEGQPDCRP